MNEVTRLVELRAKRARQLINIESLQIGLASGEDVARQLEIARDLITEIDAEISRLTRPVA